MEGVTRADLSSCIRHWSHELIKDPRQWSFHWRLLCCSVGFELEVGEARCKSSNMSCTLPAAQCFYQRSCHAPSDWHGNRTWGRTFFVLFEMQEGKTMLLPFLSGFTLHLFPSASLMNRILWVNLLSVYNHLWVCWLNWTLVGRQTFN